MSDAPLITKAEFIKDWCDRSLVPHEQRTAEGWTHPNGFTVAVRCNCGEEECEGWAMVSKEAAAERQ